MTYLLKARHWPVVLVISVITGVIAGGFAEVDIPLPLLSVAGLPQPVLPALGFVIVVSACVHRAEESWSCASVRNTFAHSHVVVVGALVFAVLVGVVSSSFSAQNSVLILRDFVGLTALVLVGRLMIKGRYAGLVPATYVIVAGAFARDRLGEIRAWCWIVDRDTSNPWAWLTCCIGVVAAIAYQTRRMPIFN
ncbi:hypothetical protein [Brevibacterium paucivorans]|uniref:Uncharacterized protein n=1 Tax=Brevibacterium paucivorans TaxID=170994 RepID=A0A2N6VKA7_9MICO|nr:hypothetical protein [Brevibacterium paucivorans]PMD04582.1 hypothetical protein CJ199_11260 [Brevibacterium paucivorans]